MFHHDLSGVRTQLHDLFFEGVANSLSMAFAQQVLDRFTELNYIFQKLDPDSVIRPTPQQYAASIPRKEVPQSVKAAYYPSPGQVALHDVPEPELRHRDEVKPHPLCRRL